jgi:maleylpyruvate isomerase
LRGWPRLLVSSYLIGLEMNVGPQVLLDGCIEAHKRLLRSLETLDDHAARSPSRLPGWTRGHLITHIARNADSHVRLLKAAESGRTVEQYEGGDAQRASEIESGSLRPAADLYMDIRLSAARLEELWSTISPTAWDGTALMSGTTWTCQLLPFQRWREVEIHHVDLDLGYTPKDWPDAYVAQELAAALLGVPERLTDATQPRQLLAWLLGRASQPRLELGPWSSRGAYYFAATRIDLEFDSR